MFARHILLFDEPMCIIIIIRMIRIYLYDYCISLPQCGVCNGQLGDATAGTDVRIRNGLLSCHECYIASRGENTH